MTKRLLIYFQILHIKPLVQTSKEIMIRITTSKIAKIKVPSLTIDFKRYATTHVQQPELTSVRYKVKRGPYSVISDSHTSFFTKLLGSDRIITQADECDSYNIDWLKIVRGIFSVALFYLIFFSPFLF